MAKKSLLSLPFHQNSTMMERNLQSMESEVYGFPYIKLAKHSLLYSPHNSLTVYLVRFSVRSQTRKWAWWCTAYTRTSICKWVKSSLNCFYVCFLNNKTPFRSNKVDPKEIILIKKLVLRNHLNYNFVFIKTSNVNNSNLI